MNAAIRRPNTALRRALCGTLTTALFVGGAAELAAPSAAAETLPPPRSARPTADPPVCAVPSVYTGPHADDHFHALPPHAESHVHHHTHAHLGAGPFVTVSTWQADLTQVQVQVHSRRPVRSPHSWTRPVSGVRVSAPYGIRGRWSSGHHTGIDFAVPVGTPVRSVGSGRVVFAGWSGGYGRAVTIRMRGGRYTLFAHLSRITVRPGQRVRAGTLVGRSGSTGRSTGPHLHFEVRAHRGYGSDINPVAYLARRGVHVM